MPKQRLRIIAEARKDSSSVDQSILKLPWAENAMKQSTPSTESKPVATRVRAKTSKKEGAETNGSRGEQD